MENISRLRFSLASARGNITHLLLLLPLLLLLLLMLLLLLLLLLLWAQASPQLFLSAQPARLPAVPVALSQWPM